MATEAPLATLAQAPTHESGQRTARWSGLRRSARQQWLGVSGLALLLAMVAFAVLYPALTGEQPDEVHLEAKLSERSGEHPLGADQFGRDVVVRLAYGARLSLLVAAASVSFALLVGAAIGTIASYLGGWWDELLMRAMDVLLSFPYIVLAIALAAAVGPGLTNVILIIGVIRLPHFARLARSSVITVKRLDFVLAAQALGQRPSRTIVKHVLPNCLSPLIVMASISAATAITAEAAMSFLGLGVNPPAASLGNMLSEAQNYVLAAPRLAVWPGVAISLIVLSLNLMGDALQEMSDPRLRGR